MFQCRGGFAFSILQLQFKTRQLLSANFPTFLKANFLQIVAQLKIQTKNCMNRNSASYTFVQKNCFYNVMLVKLTTDLQIQSFFYVLPSVLMDCDT